METKPRTTLADVLAGKVHAIASRYYVLLIRHREPEYFKTKSAGLRRLRWLIDWKRKQEMARDEAIHTAFDARRNSKC